MVVSGRQAGTSLGKVRGIAIKALFKCRYGKSVVESHCERLRRLMEEVGAAMSTYKPQ